MVVIRRTWGGFDGLMGAIPDWRSKHTYEVAEIVMAGLSMFLFRRGSRHQADHTVRGHFEQNYLSVFGLRLPIMETVEKFLRQLPPEALEELKRSMVNTLVRRKTLDRWRYFGHFPVSVDGTGLMGFDHQPFEGCPYKVSKTGKVTWTAYVLEAKLCCGNGWCLSLASEWFNSGEDIGDKQDCEQKAFKRLAAKLKSQYPRLPIIILADALYPNRATFDICTVNGWKYIIVLKEGCLPSVWEEANALKPLNSGNQQQKLDRHKGHWIKQSAMFINGIPYKGGHLLNWTAYTCEKDNDVQHRFVHLTNLPVNKQNVWDVCECGRMRWHIENQGFNAQKNSGLGLQHKYARKHLWSMMNFYQLLQIAHMVAQLAHQLKATREMMAKTKMTIKAAIEDMVATMVKTLLGPEELETQLQTVKQLRY